MSNVSHVRSELKTKLTAYRLINDCLAGEEAVKARKTDYLPKPNSFVTEEGDRYTAYITRANFYSATKRTLDGLCGQIFMRDPVIEVDSIYDPIVANTNGLGVNLIQLSKKGVRYALSLGRAGLFVDYPVTEKAVSRQQIIKGDIRPTITLYRPEHCINWRTKERNGRQILSLVVLKEIYADSAEDDFVETFKERYRVLKLVNDVYTVEVHTPASEPVKRGKVVTALKTTYTKTSYTPTKADGSTFDEIPFSFIGAENNDADVDEPPLYDIASLNIAHYRNSADYEESVFVVGQPTPVLTGLTEDWVKNVLNGKVQLGSRAAICLPTGGSASLLQASPNNLVHEAMKHKEELMITLGARLVTRSDVARTASEATIDYTTESSVLASVAKNVSAAFRQALMWCGYFIGNNSEPQFELNTDFDIAAMSSEERRQLLADWQGGLIAWEEARGALRKAGIATLDNDSAREKIDEELASIPDMTGTPANGTAAV